MSNTSKLFAAAALAVLSLAGTSQASLFQLGLGANPAVLPGAGNSTISVYVKADTFQANPSQAFLDAMASGSGATQAGGIRGFQVDLISANHGVSGVLNINNTNWKWAGSIATEFSTNKGVRKDSTGGPNAYVADGDLDNEGVSISDAGGFNNTTLGTTASSTIVASGPWAGWSKVADIAWNFTNTDTITPFVIGPTFYDSNATQSNFQANFTTVEALPVTVTVPEPATLGLAGVGALGLLARRRRA